MNPTRSFTPPFPASLVAAALALAAVAVAFAVAAPEAAAKQTTIKTATLAPEGSNWMNIMQEFDKELRERTGGEVGFKFYPGGQQGEEKEVIRKMRAGQLQAATFTGMGLGAIVPAVRVMELPFHVRTHEEMDYLHEKLDGMLEAEFEKKGYVLIGWAEIGFVHLFSTKPLKTVEDVRGAKPWVWEGDPVAEATYRAFGVSPTPLAIMDVITMLQTGHVDTVYASPEACIVLQWSSRLEYMADVPLGNATGALLVQKTVFDRLAPEHQATLRELGRKYGRKIIEKGRQENVKAVESMKKDKIEVIAWEPSSYASFVEVGAKVADELAGKLYSKELLEDVRRHLADVRKAKEGAGGGGGGGGAGAPGAGASK